MGFSLEVSVPALTVFLQGLLSFFSPCVLPLIPLYMGYLSGGINQIESDGEVHYDKKKVMVHTVFFVLGISFTFFLLGLGVSALGTAFKDHQALFARVGGILIIVFGLYQLDIFGKSRILGREHRLPFKLDKFVMSPWTALLMGFTFSFSWTPCVGPVLSSVLLMAASASTKLLGFVLIGIYTLGFVLPFLAVGLFSTTLLSLFKKHHNLVKYTVKLGAVLMIIMGIMMFSGKLNSFTGYLSNSQSEKTQEEREGTRTKNEEPQADSGAESESEKSTELLDAIDFKLKDQFGVEHKLSDYKGKVIFMNFWATWCPPCQAEMPDIQKIYEDQQSQENSEVVILGIAAPDYGKEQSQENIEDFLEQNGYSYPVLMDEGGILFEQYGVYSYPTTFMVTREGKIFGYVSGQISESVMQSIITQTLTDKRDD
jgi:cytochrome c-type biogenesis protein